MWRSVISRNLSHRISLPTLPTFRVRTEKTLHGISYFEAMDNKERSARQRCWGWRWSRRLKDFFLRHLFKPHDVNRSLKAEQVSRKRIIPQRAEIQEHLQKKRELFRNPKISQNIYIYIYVIISHSLESCWMRYKPQIYLQTVPGAQIPSN